MERVCIRKHKFASEDEAHAAAARAHLDRGVELRAYECWCCHGWHLTRNVEQQNPRYRPARKSAREQAYLRHAAESRKRYGGRGGRSRRA